MNHNLPIEKGRYNNILGDERLCTLCNCLGDEFHYIFECKYPQIIEIRNTVLSNYYRINPSMNKFISLIDNLASNRKLCVKFGKLLKCIFTYVK